MRKGTDLGMTSENGMILEQQDSKAASSAKNRFDAKSFFCVHLVQIKGLPEEEEHVPACFNFL